MQTIKSSTIVDDSKEIAVIDLGNPYELFSETNNKHKNRIKLIKRRVLYRKTDISNGSKHFLSILRNDESEEEGDLIIPFNFWYNHEPCEVYSNNFAYMFPFMSELIQCDDKLFHKFMCYFSSPKRFFDPETTTPCLVLSNPLIKFREYYKIYETSNEELSSTERCGWINIMLQLVGINTTDEFILSLE